MYIIPQFLLTDYWRTIRELIFYVHGTECALCVRTDSPQLHHKHYRSRGKEWLYWQRDLVVLCGHCHAKFHDKLKTP